MGLKCRPVHVLKAESCHYIITQEPGRGGVSLPNWVHFICHYTETLLHQLALAQVRAPPSLLLFLLLLDQMRSDAHWRSTLSRNLGHQHTPLFHLWINRWNIRGEKKQTNKQNLVGRVQTETSYWKRRHLMTQLGINIQRRTKHPHSHFGKHEYWCFAWYLACA